MPADAVVCGQRAPMLPQKTRAAAALQAFSERAELLALYAAQVGGKSAQS